MNIKNAILSKFTFSKQNFKNYFMSYFFVFITTFFILFYENENNKILHFLITLSISSLGVGFFLQNKSMHIFKKIFLYLLSIFIIFLCMYFSYQNIIYIYVASIIFMFSTQEFSSNKHFIFTNFTLLSNIAFAAICCLILFLAKSSIYSSIKYLFDIQLFFSDQLNIIIFSLIFPLLILQNIKQMQQNIVSFFKNTFILRVILVPFTLIYFIILYMYFLKIIITHELPRGHLSWIILSFIFLCLFVRFLLIVVENKQKITKLFYDYCFCILIIPIIFLYISIFIRIQQYGFTEPRFMILFFSIFFSIVCILYIFKKNFNLKYIFLLLVFGFLLIFSSPINPTSISVNSQFNTLVLLLNEQNVLKNGKIIPFEKKPLRQIRAKITSLLQYLSSSALGQEKLQKLIYDKYESQNQIYKKLNILSLSQQYESSTISFANKSKIAAYSGTYDYSFYFQDLYENSKNEFYYSTNKIIKINFTNANFEVVFENNAKISFDLSKLLSTLEEKNIDEIDKDNFENVILVKNATKLTPKVKLQIDNIIFFNDKIENISGYLLFNNN